MAEESRSVEAVVYGRGVCGSRGLWRKSLWRQGSAAEESVETGVCTAEESVETGVDLWRKIEPVEAEFCGS